MSQRRTEYDVSNQVNVTDASEVLTATHEVLSDVYKRYDSGRLNQAFDDCNDLFDGRYYGYLPCDTLYHDKQHTMDMTLALARLINGHDRSVNKKNKIGANRALVAIITALFHDSGYIRKKQDSKHYNGAEYTLSHVSRSAKFLENYFNELGLEADAKTSSQMVHYTGYEVSPEKIILPDRRLHIAGHMLGTADLIAQMSDRCYLEKCRDRLYPEFVLGGLAVRKNKKGDEIVIYASSSELLRKSSGFYKNEVKDRLDKLFDKVYNYEAVYFDGKNLYSDALLQNQDRLKRAATKGSNFESLNRKAPENYGTDHFPGLREYLNLHPHLLPSAAANLVFQ